MLPFRGLLIPAPPAGFFDLTLVTADERLLRSRQIALLANA